jgi:hypothetical protein
VILDCTCGALIPVRAIHAPFKVHFQAAGFVPFPAGYAARSPWIPCGTTNFVKRSKAQATRTAEATLFGRCRRLKGPQN